MPALCHLPPSPKPWRKISHSALIPATNFRALLTTLGQPVFLVTDSLLLIGRGSCWFSNLFLAYHKGAHFVGADVVMVNKTDTDLATPHSSSHVVPEVSFPGSRDEPSFLPLTSSHSSEVIDVVHEVESRSRRALHGRKEKQGSGWSSTPESGPDQPLTCQDPHPKWPNNHGKATSYYRWAQASN